MEKSFTTAIKLYIIGKSSGCGSVWLERTAGGREVAGSILSPRLIYCGGEPKFGLARDFGGRLRFRSVLFGTSGDCRSIFLF